MQLGQLLVGTDLSSGQPGMKVSKPLSTEGVFEETALSDEQIQKVADELGLPLQDIPPEMLNLLRQWIMGGESSSQAATSVDTSDMDLPPFATFASQLGQSMRSASALTIDEGITQLAAVEGMSEKLFADMAARLSDAMPKAVENQVFSQVQGGAVSFVPGDLNGQPFNQVLTNNLLAMAVPQKITDVAWPQAMGDRLLWMVRGDQQMAELKITPPNLGTVEIRLTINNDQASVSFVSNHAAVRDAIEQAIPRLREMMQEESVNLTNVDVGERHLAKQSHDNGGGENHSGGSSSGESDGMSEPPSLENMSVQDASGLGLIDLFV